MKGTAARVARRVTQHYAPRGPDTAPRKRSASETRVLRVPHGGAEWQWQWQMLCDHYQNRCAACNREAWLTRDHIKPLSQGGSDTIENIQPLCYDCNAAKADREIDFRNGKRRADRKTA